jgi:hypothetical protein
MLWPPDVKQARSGVRQVLFGWQQGWFAPPQRQTGNGTTEPGAVVQTSPDAQVLPVQQGSKGRILPAGGTFPQGRHKLGSPFPASTQARPVEQVLLAQQGSNGRALPAGATFPQGRQMLRSPDVTQARSVELQVLLLQQGVLAWPQGVQAAAPTDPRQACPAGQSLDVRHWTQTKAELLQNGVGAAQATQAPPEPQVASALVVQTPLLQHLPLGQAPAVQVPPLAALQQTPLHRLALLQAVVQVPPLPLQALPLGQSLKPLQPQV